MPDGDTSFRKIARFIDTRWLSFGRANDSIHTVCMAMFLFIVFDFSVDFIC